MTEAPVQIRNPEVVRKLRRLANERRLPISQTVGALVDAELARSQQVTRKPAAAARLRVLSSGAVGGEEAESRLVHPLIPESHRRTPCGCA